jgi:hypothetical protein
LIELVSTGSPEELIQLKIQDNGSNPNLRQAVVELGGWTAIFNKTAQILSEAITNEEKRMGM